MEPLYRDFAVCENCGEHCYLGNRFCEDCANDLWEVECKLNRELPVYQEAFDLACEFIENYSDGSFDTIYLHERLWFEAERRVKEKLKNEFR